MRHLIKHLLLWGLVLSGCGPGDHYGDAVISPSGKYAISARVNRTDKNHPDYTHVVIHLTNAAETELLDVHRSRAGDVMKWAPGWMPNEDIVILQSSDVGSMAFRIENDSLVEITPISDEMSARAEILKAKKY